MGHAVPTASKAEPRDAGDGAQVQNRGALERQGAKALGDALQKLWPPMLEACHLTESDLERLLWDMRKAGTIVVDGLMGKERSLKDYHVVRLAVTSATAERRCPRCGADAEPVEVETSPGRREMFCEQCRPG